MTGKEVQFMRITNNMITSKLLLNLNNNLGRMDRYQEQFETGKLFNKPSDNPIGVSRSLELTTAIAELEQYKRNTENAQSWFEITETAIKDIKNILQRARELSVQASNGTNTNEDRRKTKEEMIQLREQLIKIGNTTYAGKYVFSGYKTNQPLLDAEGKYAIDSIAEPIAYEVGISDQIQVNVLGYQLFGVKPDHLDASNRVNQEETEKGAETELIAVFDALTSALETNDEETINKSLTRIDKQIENILSIGAEIGAKTNRMERMVNRIKDDSINFKGLLSKNEDADLAEVIIHLKSEEAIYRASLAAGSKIIQPSLVDFIR